MRAHTRGIGYSAHPTKVWPWSSDDVKPERRHDSGGYQVSTPRARHWLRLLQPRFTASIAPLGRIFPQELSCLCGCRGRHRDNAWAILRPGTRLQGSLEQNPVVRWQVQPLRAGVQVLIEGNRCDEQGSAVRRDRDRLRRSRSDAGHDRCALHTLYAAVPLTVIATCDPGFVFSASTAEAERTLLRGFTAVRDLGSPVFSFKQAIDSGVIPGPRLRRGGTPCGD